MDPIFEQEQAHLRATVDKLHAIEAQQQERSRSFLEDASADKESMAEELTVDLSDFDSTLETLAAVESMNRIVDGYNLAHATAEERLARVRLLLAQPYFAKVVLQFDPASEPREIYLGVAGMTDETGRSFIVDWRSPVAETYYNQSHGPTSYVAHGRTIEVDLKLRRQFDIKGATLKAYFDTTVAIEDPLLLQALSRQHGSTMRAITATIQKEQNAVIRAEDAPVMLVRGIAGSGKTSVLMQRIAYLLYQHRDDLRPDQLHLLTPNRVFSHYISEVLPDMGEHNPHTFIWADLAKRLDLPLNDRSYPPATVDAMRRIDELCRTAKLLPSDCRAIRWNNRDLIPAKEVGAIARRFGKVDDCRRQCARVIEELHERLSQRIRRDAVSDWVQAQMLELSHDEQCRRFGAPLDANDEEQMREAGRAYVERLYIPAAIAIDQARWIDLPRLAKRLLGTKSLQAIERAYLLLSFAAVGDADARYVLVDEVQDYSVAQLMVLARYYPQAHFLLLGDPNQAIYHGTASFKEIAEVFASSHGEVREYALMTSYRSTPEVTKLFCQLAEEQDRFSISSVQRPGAKPHIIECADVRSYRRELFSVIMRAEELQEGLTAVIASNQRSVRELRHVLGDMMPRMLKEEGELPTSGVLFTTLPLAKGLEFDRVIVVDAQEDVYGDDELSRCRLYTALSRATQEVTIISHGPLTPLLDGVEL